MTTDENVIRKQLISIMDACNFTLSTEKPSVWAQNRMHMEEGNFQGMLSHDITPYWTEILDNLSPYSGYEEVVLMGGSQGGKTKAIIEPIICYYISEHPCNIGYISGNTDLALESMIDLDKAIKNANMQHLIRPSTNRVRNSRSGDTNKMKEYAGGNLIGGSATNHRTFRRRNWRLIVNDDIEEANDQSAKAGSTVSIIKKRANSYGKNKKIFWCSTPLLVNGSIIYVLYLKGDQRKYHIPCQCCGAAIHLDFEILVEGKERAGIWWKYDSNDRLKPGSVEYICQICGHGFSEKNKYKFNKDGLWIPTAEPESDALISYYWNNLYCAPGMDNWDTIVREWISANPRNQPRKEKEVQTFYNLRLGLPYTPSAESPEANKIQKNIRNYNPGEIPEKLSMADGNGRIVLITCAADMNGKVNDARLDYEILAHSEKGATYSVLHGSIGTFVRGVSVEEDDAERQRWTYEKDRQYSVFPKFTEIIQQTFVTDTGRRMTIMQTGLDCGYFSANYAYPYVDSTRNVIGLKGKGEEEYLRLNKDVKYFNQSSNRANLYILTVGKFKDDAAEHMQLNWTDSEPSQPYGFMNFPHPSGGLYEFSSYFEHYQGEHPIMVANKDGIGGQYRWEKKNSNVVNHFWDCRIYNMAVREIILSIFAKEWKLPKLTWHDWAAVMAQGIEQVEKTGRR